MIGTQHASEPHLEAQQQQACDGLDLDRSAVPAPCQLDLHSV